MAETLVLGHRGAPREAPENTTVSFRRALALGADGVELDVRRTLDGALVCHHDTRLGRTNVGDALVQEMESSVLRELDAGSWFDARFADVRVPTLDAALAALADATLVCVEAKMPEGDRDLLLPSISDTLGEYLRVRVGGPPLLVVSRQVHVLREIHELAPAPRLAAVVGRALAAGEWRFVLGLPIHVVALRGDLCTAERIADATAAGHEWIAWTINDADRARRLRDAGAMALVTDDPGGIAAALRE